MALPKTYPKSFSHIGITVPDSEEGWYVIMKPSKVKKKAIPLPDKCIDVFADNWEEFEIAHLSTSDGTGMFSFPNGVKEAPEFKPFNTGLFHFCIQDPNIEELIEKILAHGGKQRMAIG